ncbi:receptor-like protein EIX2 [Neltuma alba]|uniref:receptor-like protein EIX2 n=1 Tax=Neltuma alba TaxID=207710 RepID=UPI0010A596C5|nr:receptor-like protein EIX2 [Prosopis alba]
MASFASQISLLLLFLLFATTLNRVMSCNENDQRLLLIFKQGVVDPTNQLSSWSVEEDCCLWEGVHCHNITGRVTELSLFNHSLGGEISLCVLQLKFLNHVDLSDNDFETVSMPPCQISKSPFDAHNFHNQSLATPSNHSASFSVALRYLNFSYNHGLAINDLYWLSQLSSLKYLDLSDSDIGDDTKWLQHIAMLPSLFKLHLSGCRLRDFPSLDYINLTSLEVLDLSYNYYMVESKLPDSFFNITHQIHHLDLGFCNFHGQLPKSLLNLQNLKYLDFSFNNLEGLISDWLGQYEQLQYLDIRGNLFDGVIPSFLGNISSLLYLDLSCNQLSGNLLETLGQLRNLNLLHVGHNSLVGALTEKNFANLSNLISLDLSSTSFEFDIDPKWVPPFQLKALYLGNTSIGHNVSPWLYTQRSLSDLNISASGISNIDADVFWSFISRIGRVDISNNLIGGDNISNVIISANMSYFDASHNSLSGSIFSLLCHQESEKETNLEVLDLSHNNLSGTLPDCWNNWKKLKYLNLGSNKLTGKVPPSLTSLNLYKLDLSDNGFFGKFSLDKLNWTNLEYLLLDRNKFSGSLPIPMAENLGIIKLRTNQFTGNIPTILCELSYLNIIDLAENKLSGSIPHCLRIIEHLPDLPFWAKHLPYIIDQSIAIVHIFTKGSKLAYQVDSFLSFGRGIIDLSANSLSGEIPEELVSMSKILSLNLSRNYLTGKIPKEIGGMKYLESLDLSYNKLLGEIPSTISNLSFLAYLNLSYNNFIRRIPSGTQIQSFDSWSFLGNPELCGDPLPKKCNKKEETHGSKLAEEDEDDSFLKSLYLGMGVGFAVGFWGVCGSLFLIRAWRHKFFRWFGHLTDQLYVALALCFKSFG